MVDLESGRVATLPLHCPAAYYSAYVGLSPDGNRLFYPGCPNDEKLGSQLRVHDYDRGEDLGLVGFEGQLNTLQPTPGASRLLVLVRESAERTGRWTYRYLVVDARSGASRMLDVGPVWIGDWLDETRLVIQVPRGPIEILDVESGNVEMVTGGGR